MIPATSHMREIFLAAHKTNRFVNDVNNVINNFIGQAAIGVRSPFAC